MKQRIVNTRPKKHITKTIQIIIKDRDTIKGEPIFVTESPGPIPITPTKKSNITSLAAITKTILSMRKRKRKLSVHDNA